MSVKKNQEKINKKISRKYKGAYIDWRTGNLENVPDDVSNDEITTYARKLVEKYDGKIVFVR